MLLSTKRRLPSPTLGAGLGMAISPSRTSAQQAQSAIEFGQRISLASTRAGARPPGEMSEPVTVTSDALLLDFSMTETFKAPKKLTPANTLKMIARCRRRTKAPKKKKKNSRGKVFASQLASCSEPLDSKSPPSRRSIFLGSACSECELQAPGDLDRQYLAQAQSVDLAQQALAQV